MKVYRDEKLDNLTHSASITDANVLVEKIKDLEKKGVRVIDAFVRGNFVPNKYFNTKGMFAPGWKYDGFSLNPYPFQLETRSFGKGCRFGASLEIPAGEPVPIGKCIKRYRGAERDVVEVRW